MGEISRDSARRIIVDWIDEFLNEVVGDPEFIKAAEWPPIVADLFAALRTDLVELRNLIREATP